jgi:hypothetical protein
LIDTVQQSSPPPSNWHDHTGNAAKLSSYTDLAWLKEHTTFGADIMGPVAHPHIFYCMSPEFQIPRAPVQPKIKVS